MDNSFENIKQKLNTFIKKYYTNELIKGLILFFSFGFLYFLFILFIEYFLWLSSLGRSVLFWLFISVELFLLIRFIGFPVFKLLGLKKGITKTDAATIIGKHFKNEVDDSLLNLLQLNNFSQKSALLLASIEQKSRALKPIPFQFAVNFKENTKYLKYAVLPLVLLLFIYFSGNGNQLKKSYTRVTHFNESFEKEAPFHFTVLSDLKVLATSKKKIQVKVSGKYLPKEVIINYKNEHYFLKRINDSLFEYEFPNINTATAFYFTANSVQSKKYKLEIIATPTIKKLQLALYYPKHTHKKNEILAHTGNVTVPEGTKIQWQVFASNTDSIHFTTTKNTKPFLKKDSIFTLSKNIKNSLDYTISSSNKAVKNYEKLNYRVNVIKDEFPTIHIKQATDSIDNTVKYYLGNAADDYGLKTLQIVYYKTEEATNKQKKQLVINKSTFSQFVFTFPGNLSLEQGKEYQYYFEVFDNDVVNGFKSTKSTIFNYKKLTNEEKNAKQLEDQNEAIKSLEKSVQKAAIQKQKLEKLNTDLAQKKELTWKDKKRLNDFIKRQEQYDKILKQKTKTFDKKLDQFNNKKDDPFKKALQERIKEMSEKEIKKREKLLDELKKLSDKLKKEDLIKKIEELSKKNKQDERSLEQILELTKRYYVNEKMNQLADKLDKLAKKQEALAKENKKDIAAQEALKKEFDKIKKELQELDKKNQELKQPIKKPNTKQAASEVNKEMQKAKTDMEAKQSEGQKSESAKGSQSKAAKKMKQMSQKMKAAAMASSGGSSGEEMNPEDIATLKQILENLVTFSLDQEAVMNKFSSIDYKHPSFAKYLKEQYKLQNYFQYIDDSIFALALRQPKISKKITDKLEDVAYNITKTLEKLPENQLNAAQVNQQYTITYANDLAYLLSRMLEAAQNPPPPKMGKGSCSKPGGMQLQDIIKKQGDLSEQMKQGMKQGEKGKQGKKPSDGEEGKEGNKPKNGENGKNGKDGEKGNKKGGKNESDSDEMDGEMFKIYQQQQELKNQLKELINQEGIPDNGLLKRMDDIEKELLYKGFSNGVLQKMQNLKHELLKLKNASFTQGEEDKREARTNQKEFNKTNIPNIKNILKYFEQDELLNRKPLPLKPLYKEKVNYYFKEKTDD